MRYILYRDICVGALCCLKLNMESPRAQDSIRDKATLVAPPRPEQRRAPAARGARRGMHGMGQITLRATTARHSINARKPRWVVL